NDRGKGGLARVYQNMWRESSSESVMTDSSPKPSSTNTNVHHPSSASSRSESHYYRTKEGEINDFFFSSRPSTSKHNYTFSSSRRRPSTPSTM
ncbi:hypothetical protein GE061_017377, partial [Apolygus lucorum]